MQPLARMIGLGYLALCLLMLAVKAFVPLPGAIGYAPLALPIGPTLEPVELVIWYGTEKEAWLQDAARRFEAGGATANGRPIRITLVGMGSREIAERVAAQDWRGDPPPAAISPASSLWVELLRSEWAARNSGQVVSAADPGTPLMLTPLVAVAWGERAGVLWPGEVRDFWGNLHDALADERGWVGVAERNGFAAGSPEHQQAEGWGFVKLGHTSPLTSNSGAQTLMLLAYAYHNKAGDLSLADVAAPGFQAWLREIEGAVDEFGDSTGRFMTNMVQFGPSRYDLVLVYENLAIENIEAAQSRWGQPLRVYYPPATIFSDHPYTILQEPLTDADQRAAAEAFRDFLLSQPIQALALEAGFRPANPAVSIASGGSGNPFVRYAGQGVAVDVAQQVETPSGEVVTALLELWRREVGR